MSSRLKKATAGVAALAALGLGGAAVAGAATSSTTSSGTSTGTTTGGSGTTTSSTGARPSFPAPGTAAHEDQEKPVTGDTAAKVQAAAVKSVGSGTAGAVTTDFTGKGYETTVTKSDGSKVEVHLDSAMKVMTGPGGHGGPGHGPGMPGANGASGPPSGSGSGAPPAGTSQG